MKKSFLYTKEKILLCMLLYTLLLANIAAIRIGVASTETKLYVEPSSITDPTLLPPANFTINIYIANVTNLQGYEVYLHYETTILTGLGVIILQSDHSPSSQSSISSDAGVMWINVTYEGEPITTDTPVKLAKIQFQVVALGESILDLYDTKLVDPQSILIPHEAFDGYFNNRDNNPPTIGDPSQQPEIPDDGETVTISVDATDEESGVRNVTLWYRTNEGAWTNVTMNKLTGNTYTGEIPGFPAGTNVHYYIIAYDNAGNPAVKDNLGEYFVYTVIPEFPAALIMVLFIAATLVAVLLGKKAWPRKRRNSFVAG